MKSFPKLQRQPTDCFDELEDDALQQVMQGLTVPRTGISSIIDKLKQTGCLDEDEPPHQSDSPGMASLTPKLLLQATEDDGLPQVYTPRSAASSGIASLLPKLLRLQRQTTETVDAEEGLRKNPRTPPFLIRNPSAQDFLSPHSFEKKSFPKRQENDCFDGKDWLQKNTNVPTLAGEDGEEVLHQVNIPHIPVIKQQDEDGLPLGQSAKSFPKLQQELQVYYNYCFLARDTFLIHLDCARVRAACSARSNKIRYI